MHTDYFKKLYNENAVKRLCAFLLSFYMILSVFTGSEFYVFADNVKRAEDTAIGSLYYGGEKISGIEVTLNPAWFYSKSDTYNHSLSTLCSQILVNSYTKTSDLKLAISSLGFEIDDSYFDFSTARDEVNYFIVSKRISDGKQFSNLVFICCVGSVYKQWNSNFDPDSTASSASYSDTDFLKRINHLGFNDAKNYIKGKLGEYLEKYSIDINETKVLLTGHSRGGAAANLLAADLIDNSMYVKPENLFTYTFAAPNVTNNKSFTAESYKRIFNIVNPNDIITKILPSLWGFSRYGTTYALPTKTNDKDYGLLKEKMLSNYKLLRRSMNSSESFNDFENGEEDVYAAINDFSSSVGGIGDYYSKKCLWSGRNYLSPSQSLSVELKRMTAFEFFQSGLCPMFNGTKDKTSAKQILINPLYANSSVFKSVASYFISSNNISSKYSDAHSMNTYCGFMMGMNEDEVKKTRSSFRGCVSPSSAVEIRNVSGDGEAVITKTYNEAYFWLPSDGKWEVTVNGGSDYTLVFHSSDRGEEERVNYFKSDLSGSAYSHTLDFSFFSGDCSLNGGSSSVRPSERFKSDNKRRYTVKTDVTGNGTATEIKTVTSGDYVTLDAEGECSDFLGWYNGNMLVSKRSIYRFRPTSNANLNAKFTNAVKHSYDLGVITEQASYTKAGTRIYTCKVCGATLTESIPKLKLKRSSIKKIKRSINSFTVSWKSVKGARGYIVQYSVKRNMKNAKKIRIRGANKKKFTVKNLEKNTKYYVRIRAYRKTGNKIIYSKWSKKKAVITK